MLRTLDPDQPVVTITVDGAPVGAFAGETVAACLMRHGLVPTRVTPSGRPRAPYCLMGACFECTVELDGRTHLQACLTPVRDGMVICRNLPE